MGKWNRHVRPGPAGLRYWASALVTAILLAGCASLPNGGDRASLQERAAAFWEARMAGDWLTAYQYESASVEEGGIDLQAYVRKQGLIFKSAKVTGVVVKEGNEAIANVEIAYVIPGFASAGATETSMEDPWVLIDGQWYHHHTRSSPFAKERREGRE